MSMTGQAENSLFAFSLKRQKGFLQHLGLGSCFIWYGLYPFRWIIIGRILKGIARHAVY